MPVGTTLLEKLILRFIAATLARGQDDPIRGPQARKGSRLPLSVQSEVTINEDVISESVAFIKVPSVSGAAAEEADAR